MSYKTLVILVISLLIGINLNCANKPEEKEIKLDTKDKKASYAAGYDFAKRMSQLYKNVDADSLIKGITDGLKGGKELMTEQERRESLMQLGQEMRQQAEEERNAQLKANKEEGIKFLQENAKKEGVKTTKSGLQYKVIKEGTGPSPKETDTVKVHYKGRLINGTEFDSSYSRGEPAVFPLNRVIKGWTEGLQLMKVGGKYELYIPPELAYGDQGAGNAIEPGSVLIFEVELLDIVKEK
jgi:FKBP-type peptidyl-prolyl cis-trans isomerase